MPRARANRAWVIPTKPRREAMSSPLVISPRAIRIRCARGIAREKSPSSSSRMSSLIFGLPICWIPVFLFPGRRPSTHDSDRVVDGLGKDDDNDATLDRPDSDQATLDCRMCLIIDLQGIRLAGKTVPTPPGKKARAFLGSSGPWLDPIRIACSFLS